MIELKQLLKSAVRAFCELDVKLLSAEAHEQAIAHRIAFYLEDFFTPTRFSDLDVDCEYNLHLKDSKRINIENARQFRALEDSCACKVCKKMRLPDIPRRYSLQEKLFRPDIVVHHRGDDTRNELAVEIKATKICPFDLAKLQALTLPTTGGGHYEYRIAAFVYFSENRPLYLWFRAGERLG